MTNTTTPDLSMAAMKHLFDATDHDAGRTCLNISCTDCGGPAVTDLQTP